MMSHKIFQILDSLGLVAQNRVLHVQFSNASLYNQVFLQRIEGEHTLNQGSVAELLCLSTNAHIAFKTIYWLSGCHRSGHGHWSVL